MAGNFPDVPGPRLAFDRDGTIVTFAADSGAVTQFPASAVETMNSEHTSGAFFHPSNELGYHCVIFPENRDIVGYLIAISAGMAGGAFMERSNDTTNGFDGTWTAVATPYIWISGSATKAQMRNNINALTINGVRAIRFRKNATNQRNPIHLHLYGTLSAGENPDRLRVWHPTLDEPLDDANAADGAYFDWAEFTRGSTLNKTFRIKNNSATLTAQNVTISQQTLTDATPAINSQFTFSDGGAFATSINIGNLAPGFISPIITKRLTLTTSAALSLWTSRTLIDPSGWV